MDYSQYDIYTFDEQHYAYHQDWAKRVLLKCKTPYPEAVDEATFYDPQMIKSNMKHQVNYIKSLHKVFYEFKLVEIMSDREVKEHLSFVFPHYETARVQEEHKPKEESESDDEAEKEVQQKVAPVK